jgi:hypothetical protein
MVFDMLSGNWNALPVGYMVVFAILAVWSSVWKGMAMWKAGRKNSVVWFIVLFLVNTAGILDILYIYVFSQMKPRQEEKPVRHRRRSSSRRKRRR